MSVLMLLTKFGTTNVIKLTTLKPKKLQES